MKPFVFAHRGASGYEIENTLSSFKKAVRMGAGIETDVQKTKDKELICFHDYFIEANSEKYDLKNMTMKKLRSIKFADSRKIPTVQDVFELFHENDSLRYSFDIRDKFAGFKLIDIAQKFNLLDKIEITDRRLKCISSLRSYNNKVKIVHTLPEIIKRVKRNTVNFDFLKEMEVYAINLTFFRSSYENFKEIINNGIKCYIWGVNTRFGMKKVLKLKFKNEVVDAVYTDYPDIFIHLRDQIQG